MPGQGLDEAYVVVPKHLKYNTGIKSAKIAGGVGKGARLAVRAQGVVGQPNCAGATFRAGPESITRVNFWPSLQAPTPQTPSDDGASKSDS